MYGPSESGKTLFTLKLMHVLQDRIDQVLVISPSNPENGSYDNTVDKLLIHENIEYRDPEKKREKKGAASERFLEKIWNRQSMAVAVYKRASNATVLAKLFARLNNRRRADGSKRLRQFKRARNKARKRFIRAYAGDQTRLEDALEEQDDKYMSALVLIYKKLLTPHAGWLQRKRLDDDEKFSLQYLHFNPRLLLIFDDCATEVFFGKEMFKRFFYRGRHVMITTIIVAQDDTDLPTKMRKNAFVSVFMSQTVCTANFDRGANNYSEATKEYINQVADEVYNDKQRKLVYVRNDPTGQNMYYLKFTKAPRFKFGSSAMSELCDAVRGDKAAMDTNNPFYERFQIRN